MAANRPHQSTAQSRLKTRVWPKLASVDPAVFKERFRQVMKSADAKHDLPTVEERANWLGVAKRTLERWNSGKTLPEREELYAISQRSEVSIDWLLGFNLPADRTKREKVGAVGDELRELLDNRSPGAAWDSAFGANAAEFANQIADEWWRSRLRRRADASSARLRELAVAIERVSLAAMRAHPELENDDGFQSEMRSQTSEARWEAARFESPFVAWTEIEGLRFPKTPRQRSVLLGTDLELKVEAAFYSCFLWRLPDVDVAVYLEFAPGRDRYMALSGAVGPVIERWGTRRHPRFLSVREASPGASWERGTASRLRRPQKTSDRRAAR